jgi:hypothetical protein
MPTQGYAKLNWEMPGTARKGKHNPSRHDVDTRRKGAWLPVRPMCRGIEPDEKRAVKTTPRGQVVARV